MPEDGADRTCTNPEPSRHLKPPDRAADGSAASAARAVLTETISCDSNAFRLRGLRTTRTETFTDAVFAFALTLLVISLDPPTTMQALTDALVHVPGFVLSASLLMVFWNGHHRLEQALRPG